MAKTTREILADLYAFDFFCFLSGGTLAHAFFPSDGRAHFDDSEMFTYTGNKGTILL